MSLTDPAYIDALWEAATPAERDEMRRLLDSDLSTHLWRAQVGRQSEAADCRADVIGYGGSAGGGKLLPLDEVLPTPTGYSMMGGVRVGDELFDETGAVCRVTALSAIEPTPELIRFTFDDGATVDSCVDHRWLTLDAKELSRLTRTDPEWMARRRAKRPSRAKVAPINAGSQANVTAANKARVYEIERPTGTVRTTREIMATLLTPTGRRNHAIPVAATIETPTIKLPVPPYTLGAWLGDGTSVTSDITGIDPEIWERIEQDGFVVTHSDKDSKRHCVRGLKVLLRDLGVLGNKHVPKIYFRASPEQRLALLQGLMDTDGHAAVDGKSEFDNTNSLLAVAVYELAISLGIKATMTMGRAKLDGRDIGPKWRVSFTTDKPVFGLTRKMARLKPCRRTTSFRYIVKAEPVESRPGRCISVDSPSRLYLASQSMIPTHNSDLIAGLSLTEFDRSVIFRREKAQTEGIIQRMTEILGSTDGYNSQKAVWRCTVGGEERLIEFGGLDNPTDHQRWQGRPHALKAYDEVTEMREFQVRFTMGWTRTSKPGQRLLRLLTFNPPTTAEGRWVIKYFAPWLDERHPRPAKPGDLRYFTTIKGEDFEVEDARPFVMFKGEPLYDYDTSDFGPEKIVVPMSRTFIPSRVTDNYFYVRSGYISTLQSLPEPLRSQMLDGDFNAGVEDDEWQVIPTKWIDEAMARWQPKDAKGEMDTLGCDPAMGGKDSFVLSPRHGTWFDQLIRLPGSEVPDGQTGAAFVIKHRRDRAVVNIDVVGWGSSTLNMLEENQVQCHRVNGANKSLEVSKDGSLKFFNYRSQIVWQMREALDPSNPNPMALPPDPALKADLAAYKWKMTASGVQVRSKDEMKADLGRSPDDGDAVINANIVTMKLEQYEEIRHEMRAASFDRYAELTDYDRGEI